MKIESGINDFKNNIIKPTDKSKLKSAINEAQNLYNNSTEGNSSGQYRSGSKSTLMREINKAKKVYNDSSVKQDEVNLATSNLNSSINTFKNAKVKDGYSIAELKRVLQQWKVEYGWDSVGLVETEKVFYNGETCYMYAYAYTKANGMEYANQAFVGSRTLNKYSWYEVGY